jgi:hypothetical protein
MRIRLWLITCAVLALTAIATARPGAQDANNEPELITRDYDLSGLIGGNLGTDQLLKPPALSPTMFADQRASQDYDYRHKWQLEGRDSAFLFDSADELEDLPYWLSRGEPFNDPQFFNIGRPGMRLEASEALHTRVAAALAMLQELCCATVKIEVLKLDRMPQQVIMDRDAAASHSTVIGLQEVANGGIADVSQLQSTPVLWSIGEKYLGATTSTDELWTGEQWLFGALLQPDGRIRLQGWHARAYAAEVREYEGMAGVTQLPALQYEYTPAAATVENGGGIVIDSPAGPYLVRASARQTVADRVLEDGAWRLCNPSGWLPPGSLTGGWLFDQPSDWYDWRVKPHLPQRNDGSVIVYETGAANEMAAKAFYDDFQTLSEIAKTDHYVVGPLVILSEVADLGRYDPDRISQGRKLLRDAIAKTGAGPAPQMLRVRLLEVPVDADLPEGVRNGSPSEAEIAALTARADAQTMFDRRLVVVGGQAVDVIDARLENYVRRVQWEGVAIDEERIAGASVATHAAGIQFRAALGTNDEIGIRAAWRPDSKIKQINLDGDLEGQVVEAPEGRTVEFSVSAILAPGGAICTAQPGTDGRVALLLVQREGGR